MRMTFQMNSPEGKTILAKARGGDFAHPGEEEAIALIAADSKRDDIRRVLDVGCGRGGTAAWFHRKNWGKIVGVDIDETSINYARDAYPEVDFFVIDVGKLGEWRPEPFDFVYLLNSFYAFPEQRLALRNIRSVCRPGASLCIFDYARRRSSDVPTALGSDIGRPIVIEDMPTWLAETGWSTITMEDWTDRYVGWYDSLLTAFERDREWITKNFGDGWRKYVVDWYGTLQTALAAGDLSGVVFRATAT